MKVTCEHLRTEVLIHETLRPSSAPPHSAHENTYYYVSQHKNLPFPLFLSFPPFLLSPPFPKKEYVVMSLIPWVVPWSILGNTHKECENPRLPSSCHLSQASGSLVLKAPSILWPCMASDAAVWSSWRLWSDRMRVCSVSVHCSQTMTDC